MVKIRDILGGYELHYDTMSHDFRIIKTGDPMFDAIEGASEIEVLDALKRLTKKKFTRIPVIHISLGYATRGHITSILKTRRYYGDSWDVWHSWKDRDGEWKREKTAISGFYQETPENVALHKKIAALDKIIRNAREEINDLCRQFKDPIDEENVFILGGLEEPEETTE